MLRPTQKLVLYFPRQTAPSQQADAAGDLRHVCSDTLPLALLAIAGLADRDGYEVRIIDGNLLEEREAHALAVEECRDALLFATTAILGHQLLDGLRCTRAIAVEHPDLPRFVGGWFASVEPDLMLATGLFDAVAVGQGELTFAELVAAVGDGSPLDEVAGLVLARDGGAVRTAPRPVAGFHALVPTPWHLLDGEAYRRARCSGGRPGAESYEDPFWIDYFGSFGCSEPCTFCCSPGVTGRHWRSVPGQRMAEELLDLHDRWGFDGVHFVDASFGVMEERTRDFARTLLAHGAPFAWDANMQARSINGYADETLSLMSASGLIGLAIGGETGAPGTWTQLAKHSRPTENEEVASRLDAHGIEHELHYMLGYPHEPVASMRATIDQARRIAAAFPHARPTLDVFQPMPGSALFDEAVQLGYRPPTSVEGWGAAQGRDDGHLSHWPGQVPKRVLDAQRLHEHYLALARGRDGWWERSARRRMRRGYDVAARLEAAAFGLAQRLTRT